MSFWMLLQVVINLFLIAGIAALWIRGQKKKEEDPRLSKGLQLLQSKIAVIEDLSDKTEHQVQRITLLLDQKCKEVQARIQEADQQLARIDQNVKKSLDVAQIFQDKIPHHEIIERQNSLKYIQAAKLANQGLSSEEIAKQVDLTIGEIDFICKVNKQELQFDDDNLPGWAQSDLKSASFEMNDSSISVDSFAEQLKKIHPQLAEEAFEAPKVNTENLQNLTAELKAAAQVAKPTLQNTSAPAAVATKVISTTGKEKIASVRPFEFKKI